MDTALYKAIMNGNQRSFDPSDPQQQQLTHQTKDTILHIAAKFNRSELASSIISLQAGFLQKKNAKDDTPLHIAARLGSRETVEVLVNFIKEKGEDLELESDEKPLKMVNARKDTALHDAARNGYYEVVELLTKVDPELAGMTNDDGESPLFLAVEKMHMSIANHLLNVDPLCSFKGRNGMNVLHAAVIRSQDQGGSQEIQKFSQYSMADFFINLSFKHAFMFACRAPCLLLRNAKNQETINWEDFIETLIRKEESAIEETDHFGWTPFHYAAHFGANKIAKLFLEKNNLDAYKRTGEGMTLLHVAANEGQVSILETIRECYPEMWDLQDNKGQTPLHTAVQSGKLQAVKLILKIPSFHSLVNQQDHDGNTALHLAIIGKHHEIFKLLVKDSKVDKTITNKEGLAVFDLAQLKQELGVFELIWIKVNLTSKRCLTSLDRAIYKGGGRPKTPKREQIKKSKGEEPENDMKLDGQQPRADSNLEGGGRPKTPKREQIKKSKGEEPENDMKLDGQQPRADSNLKSIEEEKPSSEYLKNMANANSVVATLIATVTFAAGFTMPGGYKNDGPNQGMAILSKNAAFGAFVITNALAFCFSAGSVFLYLYSSMVENHDMLLFFTFQTRYLIHYATSSMVIAFSTGTYAVLSDSPGLDAAVLGIGCLYFLIGYTVGLK